MSYILNSPKNLEVDASVVRHDPESEHLSRSTDNTVYGQW